MKTAKFAIAAAVAALSFAAAGESAAQACIGTPIVSGQRALSGGVAFPEWGTNYQARLDMNMVGPVSAHGAYTHSAVDNSESRINVVGGGLAYRLPEAAAGNLVLTACPTVEAAYAMTRGEGLENNRLEVPVGFAVGTRVNVGAGMALTPYVKPQFVFGHTSNVANNQTATSTNTGLAATVGTALDFGPFFTGVDYQTVRWNDIPGTQNQVNLRLGVKF